MRLRADSGHEAWQDIFICSLQDWKVATRCTLQNAEAARSVRSGACGHVRTCVLKQGTATKLCCAVCRRSWQRSRRSSQVQANECKQVHQLNHRKICRAQEEVTALKAQHARAGIHKQTSPPTWQARDLQSARTGPRLQVHGCRQAQIHDKLAMTKAWHAGLTRSCQH